MKCIACDGTAVTERPDLTAQGYRRFRCCASGKQFNERSGGVLNRPQYPSDVIALLMFWRLPYKLSLGGLPEMFLFRGIAFTYEEPGGRMLLLSRARRTRQLSPSSFTPQSPG